MTIRDIARVAASSARIENVIKALEEDSSLEKSDTAAMIRAARLAARQAMFDFPAIRKDCFAADDNGLIATDAFSYSPYRVYSVSSGTGEVEFTFDSRGIDVGKKGTYTVVYSVLPDVEGPIDAPLNIGVGIDLTAIGYLAACHYCIMTGRHGEADFFMSRYEYTVGSSNMSRKVTIPKRAFK